MLTKGIKYRCGKTAGRSSRSHDGKVLVKVGLAVARNAVEGVRRNSRIAQINAQRSIAIDGIVRDFNSDARIIRDKVRNVDAVSSIAGYEIFNNRVTNRTTIDEDAISQVAETIVSAHVCAYVVVSDGDTGRTEIGVNADRDAVSCIRRNDIARLHRSAADRIVRRIAGSNAV